MRLASGGRIDRAQKVPFRFAGRDYTGFRGDTLASALLANGTRLVGRSFKYHRPRGILCAGSEEPNALVEIGSGADRTPNTRATVQEIFPGLEAAAQNTFGSLRFDGLAINDHLSPFLSAGFYYKTFMWPRGFWEKLYEPLIRRAAGLGALSGEPDGDIHDKAWAHCDLLVIGSGPAGLMAALVAARAGKDVILAEEDHMPGGRLLSERLDIDGGPGADWADHALAELAAFPNVRVMTRTTITGAYDGGTYGALERVSLHRATPGGAPATTFWRIVAGRAILASGAHERPLAFANNDRPGIMLAASVRSYLHRFGVAPGRRTHVVTNNDDGYRTARDLLAAGCHVAAVIDLRPEAAGTLPCKVIAGGTVLDTRGRLGLSAVKIRDAAGRVDWVEADCLAMAGGWNPAVHLTCHMGGRPEWRADIAAFVARDGAVPGLSVAGAAAGAFSTDAALRNGAEAARRALNLRRRVDIPMAEDAPINTSPIWHLASGRKRAWLDFQNDVTVKDVVQAHAENFRSVEHMKRYTTLGMATDQGKTANIGALAIMAELTGQSIPETGTTTFRPPYTPVPIAAMGARAAGRGFAPERFTTSHALSVARGAEQIEAGLWYRPGYYPIPGDTHWRQACDREVGFVRNAVGVCDVSTLGKIDIQGPDAAALLDLVYTNRMSSLKIGRVRYGLMLREDGFVMDDGTCARLGRDHFVITTTTAAAGPVMAHLEFVAQCLRPDWDVALVSVTDHWAQFAVAGPKSTALLEGMIDTDLAKLPFMGMCTARIGGVPGRVFRISFSGEIGFEIAVPSPFGAALATRLAEAATALGGGLYGMEALNVLRIEKGFITHAEIHGRVTAADIGMARMISDAKDCIGKEMARRPVLISDDREQLVGLRPAGAAKRFFAGSHIVAPEAEAVAVNDQGYVTSVCYSPTLGDMIGLGFVKSGRNRIGETVRVVDQLRGFDTLCEICAPVFFDPDGGRMRG